MRRVVLVVVMLATACHRRSSETAKSLTDEAADARLLKDAASDATIADANAPEDAEDIGPAPVPTVIPKIVRGPILRKATTKLIPRTAPAPPYSHRTSKDPSLYHKLDAKGELATFATDTKTVVASGLSFRVHTFDHQQGECGGCLDYAIEVFRGKTREAFHPFVESWSFDASKTHLHLRGWEKSSAGAFERHDQIVDLIKGTTIELPPDEPCGTYSHWEADRIVTWGVAKIVSSGFAYCSPSILRVCVFDIAGKLEGEVETDAQTCAETGTMFHAQLVEGDPSILAVRHADGRSTQCIWDFQSLTDATRSIGLNFENHPGMDASCPEWQYDFKGFDFASPSFKARRDLPTGPGPWIHVK